MIMLGVLFPEEREKSIIENSKAGVSNAGNSFQWKVLRGLEQNLGKIPTIINVLPVGTWPKHYKVLNLQDQKWFYHGVQCYEVGCINLPLMKQIIRTQRIKKLLKENPDEEILLCTAYLPFLNAVGTLPKSCKVTAIITDIPEYYDMHRVSFIRGLLRKMNNKLVYRYMKRVDRFVLLTEQMKEPLCVGERPYIVMEGICDSQPAECGENDNDHLSILYAGRLNYRYGLGTLLDAFEQIQNDKLELWLCGSGEMEEEIKERAKKDSRIHFWGYLPHSEAVELQKKASILINPRTNEGEYTKYSFPSKTMEYMMSGKPTIMYKLDGVPDEYDQYLFYVQGDSVEALKETMESVCAMNQEERTGIAQSAQKFVAEQKNSTVQARRILELIREDKKC